MKITQHGLLLVSEEEIKDSNRLGYSLDQLGFFVVPVLLLSLKGFNLSSHALTLISQCLDDLGKIRGTTKKDVIVKQFFSRCNISECAGCDSIQQGMSFPQGIIDGLLIGGKEIFGRGLTQGGVEFID